MSQLPFGINISVFIWPIFTYVKLLAYSGACGAAGGLCGKNRKCEVKKAKCPHKILWHCIMSFYGHYRVKLLEKYVGRFLFRSLWSHWKVLLSFLHFFPQYDAESVCMFMRAGVCVNEVLFRSLKVCCFNQCFTANMRKCVCVWMVENLYVLRYKFPQMLVLLLLLCCQTCVCCMHMCVCVYTRLYKMFCCRCCLSQHCRWVFSGWVCLNAA